MESKNKNTNVANNNNNGVKVESDHEKCWKAATYNCKVHFGFDDEVSQPSFVH